MLIRPDMGTKPKVSKPKRSRSFDQITKLKPKLSLFQSTKLKPKPFYKYPFLPLITCHLLKFSKIYRQTWFENEKSSFETTKPIVKFWICEITQPKLYPNYEAKAEDEALSFWNHKAEAEAEALASNVWASWSWSSFIPMSDANADIKTIA